MLSYSTWTYLAIATLIIGAPLIFVWFLAGARQLLRGDEEPTEGTADEPER